jgi:hypothetical protein
MGHQHPCHHPQGPLSPSPLRIGLGVFIGELPLGTQSPGCKHERFLDRESLCVQNGYGFAQMAFQFIKLIGTKATEVLEACSPLPERLV